MAGREDASLSSRPAFIMSPIRILALDLSLTASGVACHACGVSTISFKKTTGPERLVSIREAAMSHVFEHQADVAAVEGYSFGSRNGGERIGELGGVIRAALWEAEVPYVEIPPKSLKKFITDNGNAGKDEMLAATIRRWPEFNGKTNNESDAYGLGVMAKSHYEPELCDEILAFQQKVLDSIEWPELLS